MAIYVKFAEEKKPKSIKEFLTKFYTNRTCSHNGQAISDVTYFNKNCNIVQSSHIRRSFDDLLELIQTYYPSTTPKILMSNLLKLKLNKYSYIMLTNCSGMKRIRISYFSGYNRHGTDYKEAIKVDKLTSKYSWEDLLHMLNIKNDLDLIKFKNEK